MSQQDYDDVYLLSAAVATTAVAVKQWLDKLARQEVTSSSAGDNV